MDLQIVTMHLALVYQQVAMKAANQDREDKGLSQAYGEDAFDQELQQIAETLRCS